MKHRIKGRKLGRNSAHRKALFRNLAVALFDNGIIKTTLPKAKDLRPYAEKLITLAKKDTLANRRNAISTLGNTAIIDKLFKEIGPNAANRDGGYTRVLKFGFRTGDKAPMAIIELVDRKIEAESENKPTDSKKSSAKKSPAKKASAKKEAPKKETAKKESSKKEDKTESKEKPATAKKETKAEAKPEKKAAKAA